MNSVNGEELGMVQNGKDGSAPRGGHVLKRTAPALVFLSVIGSVVHADSGTAVGSPDGPRIAATVQEAVARFLKDNPVPVALSIGVLSDGKTYTYNYGSMSRGDTRAPTADTLYPVASQTKTFTGTLLAQTVVDKKLKLGIDVRTYLTGSYPNLEYQGQFIRLQDLLDHRSGLPFMIPDRPDTAYEFKGNNLPFLTRVDAAIVGYGEKQFMNDLHSVTLTFKPGGNRTLYSNAGPQLVSYILEHVNGSSYEDQLKAKILLPLGMAHTCLSPHCTAQGQIATGYDASGRPLPSDMSALGASGALISSVNDMLRYVRWEADESSAAVRLSHQPQATDGEYAAGMNWQMWRHNGHRTIWQSGSIDGYHSVSVIIPGSKAGLVILESVNEIGEQKGRDVMANEILKVLDAQAPPLP